MCTTRSVWCLLPSFIYNRYFVVLRLEQFAWYYYRVCAGIMFPLEFLCAFCNLRVYGSDTPIPSSFTSTPKLKCLSISSHPLCIVFLYIMYLMKSSTLAIFFTHIFVHCVFNEINHNSYIFPHIYFLYIVYLMKSSTLPMFFHTWVRWVSSIALSWVSLPLVLGFGSKPLFLFLSYFLAYQASHTTF